MEQLKAISANKLQLQASKAWLARARKVIPGCAQTFSKGPLAFVQGAAPNFLDRAKGPFVWDVDGNRYIDYISGLGSVILGHCHPAVQEAVMRQMQTGMSYSLPHPLEVEVAERLCELIPCAEMVRFGKNGSDVTTAAVRVARAFTQRDKVARCGYHGWHDWYIGSTSRNLGVPESTRRLTLAFPYNDLDALHGLFRAHNNEISCVIMEPVTFEMPHPGYLEGVKLLCQQHGALLVFDEIVTGFRISTGGAQKHFGVTPDLACLGKGMANGFPLSAIVGRADIMTWFNKVFFSTTHGGEALSLAACLATLNEIQRTDVISHLWRLGALLAKETNELVGSSNLTDYITCVGLPSWSSLRFKDAKGNDSLLLRSLFQQEVIKRGLLTHGNHMLTLGHDEEVIEETLHIYAAAFEVLADAIADGNIEQRLEGAPLQPILRQV
jgi:glutamate-1-semialdehyde-2,1-aminomutase